MTQSLVGAADLLPLLRTAVDAVTHAGRLAHAMQADLKEIRLKGPKDIVTEADLACDEAIRGILQQAHPDHDIVTEEAPAIKRQPPSEAPAEAHGEAAAGQPAAEQAPGEAAPPASGDRYTWFVDPIDGTVNYSRGLPLWGVSVGVRRERPTGKDMVAGAIWLPVLDELYTATLGGGAFLNGALIRVSPIIRLEEAILSHGDFNIGNSLEARDTMNRRILMARMRTASAVQRIKCLGSAVVEGSLVASGRMEAYCMLAMKPWDVAVTSLLVTEAGGAVTRVDGGHFSVEGPDALFSNGLVHQELVNLLHEDIR